MDRILLFACFLVYQFGFGQSPYTSVASGNWNSDATWSGSGIPVAGDLVNIANGHTITVTAAAACSSVSFTGAAATLTINTGISLSVTNAVILNSSNTINTAATITGAGTLNCASVSVGIAGSPTATTTTVMISTISNFNISGNLGMVSRRNTNNNNASFNLASGTVNVDGRITTTNQNAANVSTFTMATGTQSGTLLLGNASPFNLSGTGINTITLTGTTATVNYDAAGSQSVGGYTYTNLTTSGSGDKTLNAAITVNNNLYVGTNTWLIDNDKQIAGNLTGTLTVQNGGVLQLGGTDSTITVPVTSFPTGFTNAHIDLQTGSEVRYNYNGKNGGTQAVSTVPTYYFLHCQFPGTKRSAVGVLTINGNFDTASPLDLNTNDPTINLSGSFNLLAVPGAVSLTSGVFSIKGNFDNDLTSGGSLVTGNGTIVFNGTVAQSITGTGIIATPFYNLTINNSSGGVSVGITGANDDITVSNTLTLTNGILTTSTTNLLDVTRTATAAISGGSSASFINGPVNWTLPASLGSGSTYNFPVGKGITYLPFSLVNPTTGTGAPSAQVEAFDVNCGGTANFTNLGSLSTTEYWSLSTTGNFTNSSVSLSRPAAISPLDAIGGSTSVNGTYASLAGTVGVNGITISSVIGTNRFFAFGRKNGIRTSAIAGSPFCAGAGVSVTYTITGTYLAGNIFTAQLSDASGSFASPVSIGSVTQMTAGTISATIPAGTVAGTGYRIRVVASTALQTVGSDNGTNLTINTTPVAPVLNDIILGCNQTSANETWSAVPNISNYRFDVSLDAAFGTFIAGYQDVSIAPSASPTESVTVNGLSPGVTYYARARAVSSCGTSVNSNVAIISVAITKTADGGVTWDNGTPDSTLKAIFTNSATMVMSLNACSCQINSGVNMVVGVPGGENADAILKLENGLDVLGSGTLTFENNASLIQTNNTNGINTGAIIYKRTAQPMNNFDYTYWSSPVAGQTLKALSPNTIIDKYFSFANNNWVYEDSGAIMTPPGKGYIIRVPKPGIYGAPYPETVTMPYAQPVQFVGVPNNGSYSLPIDATGSYNLIGNPYPSALSADLFLEENAVVNQRLEGTIYFWTHNTAVSNTGYSSADYASYNYVGGVAGTGTASGNSGISSMAPLGNIAAGQSFFTLSKNGGSVVFNNNMRVGVAGSNKQFFKGTKSKTATIEKNRVWLNMTNTEGAFKQMLVGYVTGATIGFDSAFDGDSFDGNTYIDFYSVNEDRNLVIQGRALPFDLNDKVPLGYKTTIEGTFAINIDYADGVLATQAIFVEDRVTHVIHNLKNGPYAFATLKGTFNDRFVLRYTDNTVAVVPPAVVIPPIIALDPTLENASFTKTGNALVVSVKNHQIKINAFEETMAKVLVYDLRGRLLYENNGVHSNELTLRSLVSGDQFLIVVTQLTNGKWVTKEIIF
jgi:hypothetical protein